MRDGAPFIEGWQVRADENLMWRTVDLYLYRTMTYQGRESITMLQFDEGGAAMEVALEKNVEPRPTFRVDRRTAENLAAALSTVGLKPDADVRMAATLDATRYHLEDLRKLLDITDGGPAR